MELLQKIDIKAVDNSQKGADIQAREKSPMGADTAQNSPFKDQLSKQTEQLNAQVSTKKIKINQEDKDTSVLDENNTVKVADELAATSDMPVVDELKSVAVESLLQVETDKIQLGDSDLASPVIAAPLLETGNSLPPVNALIDPKGVQQTMQEVFGSVSTNAGLGGESVQSTTAEIEALAQQVREGFNKAQANSTNTSSQVLMPESTTQKAINTTPNLATSLLEKPVIQNAKPMPMSNEVVTTEVISQASKLQQVPVTTAVSASLSAAQNISVSGPNETTAALNSMQPLSNAPANTLTSSIAVNIESQNWSQQMTQQVAYMIKGGYQQAEIKLNPAHLGPMEIKLSINDDQASVNFVTQHAPVRDVIDAALPRLKDMLEQQGLNLADADVSTQSEQQQADSEAQQKSDELAIGAVDNVEQETNILENKSVIIDSGVSIFA